LLVDALREMKPSIICCAKNSTFALLESGELFAWGSNKHGVLGIDCEGPSPFPIQILPPDDLPQTFKGIAAGSYHVALLCENGTDLLVWGKNKHG